MAFVYKITSPSGKIYIGSTSCKNVKHRWRPYKNLSCKNQRRLYNSLLKYGYINHKFEVVTECSIEDMYRLEAHYGMLYDVLGDNGLNLALPLKTELYNSRSEETKIIQSNKAKGNRNCVGVKHSDESKKNMSIAHVGQVAHNKGKHLSDEWKINLSKSHKGKILPDKTKLNMSLVRKGKKINRKTINNKKLVLDTQTGIYYDTAKDAAESKIINPGSLVNMLNPNHHHKNKTSLIYA